ncbi:CRISPR-associated helicase Cas3' [Amycolatopsis taiwanensis]|uniref:CRISPR-associated helicase/endonuclease Cas3 n=1 Tax=Amycolatopsis taiwanensis TaxID=342230 RepID=A0A9W6R3E0_9PSEU|nr:CRISPR-associated helicase Cas3' [Amycolatopsis taiwanensis]GLY68779.1 CRISPR-associated helicase/endonuclease Cas3 [Amycolatopsis taiwanensis]
MLNTAGESVEGRALGVLWGKSDANGRPNLLLQHLLDTAAVGELVWDRYLSAGLRQKIDACCNGAGRALFALFCGLHDVGKATPAFQCKDPVLAERVRQVGLSWAELGRSGRQWHHTSAGARIVKAVLQDVGWPREAVDWVWPLVLGHHGLVRALGTPRELDAHGRGRWPAVQAHVVHTVARELGVEIARVYPTSTPPRAIQLAISGAVIMADWLASDERNFGGIDQPSGVSICAARERARMAWSKLGLRGGWRPDQLYVGEDVVEARFGVPARGVQEAALCLAREMLAPGLMLVEAPMGEGKTKAALAAAEVLAERFGADGIFIGMPTQATSDPMYEQVLGWVRSIDPDVPVGLLHGKRQFNPTWRALRKQLAFRGVDEFGCDDPYGSSSAVEARSGSLPAEWFLGPKRGLLVPVTVGTVDQLLHAATRTRHVMLRHAGLAGRVVILDEVHAYDVYMSQFLFEGLRWLGDAGVPVVLLSATLPPAMRAQLARAYLQGRLAKRDLDDRVLPSLAGYPNVLSVCAPGGVPRYDQRSAAAWRDSLPVAVDVLHEEPEDGPERVVELVRDALADGGCALVVRNTVARAQETYRVLREEFGADAVLLHGRIAIGERADRAERLLGLLGPPVNDHDEARPWRLVLVATQVAEQSFDIDADFLVSDLAPIDLLLQRAGRLHRHTRKRPPRLERPRFVVAGVAYDDGRPPRFPVGSSAVYKDHLLLRSAALVMAAAQGEGWSVPAQVPELVSRGYATDNGLLPAEWHGAAVKAETAWLEEQSRRTAEAEEFLLAGEDQLGTPTLQALHERRTADLSTDEAVAAVVRDGEPSAEVLLVRHDGREYCTPDGTPLGIHGEAVSDDDVLDRLMRWTVRLPADRKLTAAVEQELGPLPAWGPEEPWLHRSRVLRLDDEWSASLGGHILRYDADLGLLNRRQSGKSVGR